MYCQVNLSPKHGIVQCLGKEPFIADLVQWLGL
jgi:hypothetical protein